MHNPKLPNMRLVLLLTVCAFLVEKQFNKDASQKNNIYWSAKVICK